MEVLYVVKVVNVVGSRYKHGAQSQTTVIQLGQSLFSGLDHWTGILDSPLTPKIAYKRLHLAPYSLVGQVGL